MTQFHAPGRINLIGEHIDYMGGTVLPVAIDIGTDLWITPRTDRIIRAQSTNFADDGVVEADLDATSPREEWGWANFLIAVAWAVQSHGNPLAHGYDVEVTGNIPNGAGLSSSASLELAFAVALNANAQLGLSPERLAVLSQLAENEFIGVACGIMDQMSIACGRKGSALAINCGSLEIEPVPFPTDVAIVVANSNKRRELADSGYNERREACETAEAKLDSGRLVDLNPEQLRALLTELSPTAAKRVRHVVTEQQRVVACMAALRENDMTRVGELMAASHKSLRDDFEVTGPELDALVEAAWDAPGVIGARMTGAGFGGCTVNLVSPDLVDQFISTVGRRYTETVGLSADFYVVHSADGAHEVAGD